MHRRDFLRTTAGSAASLALGATKRPNIVLIMADDLGFSDIGCYGGEIQTPNLDRLASKGVRFRQFYNTARCCPTRASLMTGLYSHQAGVGHMVNPRPLPSYQGDLNRKCVTIAEVLRPAGYRTLMCGKWHVTPMNESKHNWPLQRGFEHHYGTIHGAGSFYAPTSLTRDNELVEPDRKDFYYTDALSDQAAAYIRDYAPRPDPFFLYLAYTSPHWPLHALEADIDKYRGRYKDGWDRLRAERHERQIKLGIVDKRWPLSPRDAQVPAWADERDKEWQQRRMEVYAAQVDRMDQGIGRVLEALRRTGAEDNTLVLFLADNGGCAEELGEKMVAPHVPKATRAGAPMFVGNRRDRMPGPENTYQSYGLPWANASNTPFRLYKHWVHEGGISSPLIAHWPGRVRTPGSLTDQTGHLIDIMATCSDLAGARYPAEFQGQAITPLEGRSLKPVFEGKKRQGHAHIFWEHEGNRAVRQGNWKLVSRHPDRWELYDIAADRTEMNDISGRHPDRVTQMSAAYDAWAQRCGVEPWAKVSKM